MQFKANLRKRQEQAPRLSGMFVSTSLVLCVLLSACLLTNAQNKTGVAPSQAKKVGRPDVKATFESICASCHGLDAHGSERGPDIASRQEVVDKSDAELAEILKNGKTASGMPSFAAFGNSQIAALVAYLRKLQGVGDETPLPGDFANGKTLFFGTAKCSSCHMANGQGGFFGKDLTFYASRMNADEVRTRVVAPDKYLDARHGMVTVVLSDSVTISGMVRNEDNFSLQVQTPDGAFHLLNKSDIRSKTYAGRSAMPSDYASRLSAKDLNDLVSYLLRVAKSRGKPKADNEMEDGDED
jgi:cytochrome c oxidase cbb3-type subunit III